MTTDSIRLPKELETRIRDALAPLCPEKVILFGSRAWGEPTEDSDIDLYVVTQDDFVPANYEERMQTHLKVSALLREINKSVPIDLMVHTKPMHQAFVRLGSMFAREIMTRGEVLYERSIYEQTKRALAPSQ
jgi:predicted nucleotidyltransferase